LRPWPQRPLAGSGKLRSGGRFRHRERIEQFVAFEGPQRFEPQAGFGGGQSAPQHAIAPPGGVDHDRRGER
jgi:hypothetical protein